MICGVILLHLIHKITLNWIYSGEWICWYLFCGYALTKVFQVFISVLSPTAMNINSITAVTAETLENQISFDINVINLSEETNKLFEQSNDSFEEILKASKLVSITNQQVKKFKVIYSSLYKSKLQ